MQEFEMNQEDRDAIEALNLEIKRNARNMTMEKVRVLSLENFKKFHVGIQPTLKQRKVGDAYTFFSENEVNIALYKFFTNPYNTKRIAKSCYLLDEDDVFVEELDIEIPIGKCLLPNGAVVNSSMIEVIMEVRSVDSRDRKTGMPFNILKFSIIDA